MFHNYFFLKRLAPALENLLKDARLTACFSQNKDELILVLERPDESTYIIRANLDPVISLLQFPSHFSRAGKNTIDLFSPLLNQRVVKVSSYVYERSFYIGFEEGHSLIFKMHARRANILLAKENKVIDLFRKGLKPDWEIVPDQLNKDLSISKDALQAHDYNPQQLLPALGKEVNISLQREGYEEVDPKRKWTLFESKLKELEANSIFLIDDDPPRLSLVDRWEQATDDPIAATNWLYEKLAKRVFFEKEKEQIIQTLKQKIKKSESYISKNSEKMRQLEAARNPEEIANIIMANLHQIQTGLSKIVLTDFYNNTPITIPLNTALSPQKNAENYYRKAKNRNTEIESLQTNIKAKEDLIHEHSRQILAIQEIESSKELRKYKKAHHLQKERDPKPETLPYHLFELDGWQVLVGKNSKSNDELTLKVANKNDLWLHAKDVAGSHVVIKERPGQNFPGHVIEYAASLAAANSKRKTDSLCPVIYTAKKFVRKSKGAPAGQVIVEKEEVLLVEPLRSKFD